MTTFGCFWHPLKIVVSSTPQYWIWTSIFKVNIQYCFWHQLKNVGSSISNIQGQYSIFNIYCYWHPLKTAVSSTFNIDLESQYSRSIFIILYCFWHPFKIVVTSSSNIQGRYSILLLKPAQNCRIIYMLSILKVNLNVKLVWKYENAKELVILVIFCVFVIALQLGGQFVHLQMRGIKALSKHKICKGLHHRLVTIVWSQRTNKLFKSGFDDIKY